MYKVTIENDPYEVYGTRSFPDLRSTINYCVCVLRTWEGVKGSPGVHIFGNGLDKHEEAWTLEGLLYLQNKYSTNRDV